MFALVLGMIAGYALSASDRSRLTDLEATYAAEVESAEALQDQLDGLKDHIADLEFEIEQQGAELDEVDQREAELDERESAMDEREQELDDLAGELDSREESITETEDEIEENTIPGDGIWVVGDEVEPGTYKAQGSGSACYWARLGSLDTSDILDNHFGSAKVTVELHNSDAAFETSGCGSWVKQ
ncbi:hypothetical protein L0U85_15165 [Glycomyces sp. L485]|uniref:hypothetical protein n=1 Tax=Glycomyces sp. L485 TaxID=2909235 RepID=UPI001F4B6C3E|nr:hypothetical protein [Glycomyces sp. L485]MCH7232186.1 hypothetical protein [Glycomyces sp. L485]